ncbi:hypothetical protein HK096_001867 [Nowakowskiella sp. JEL0078]|nr:hypothetical protein HK096_001867 [Nowakowskiella sp. JEL0078]
MPMLTKLKKKEMNDVLTAYNESYAELKSFVLIAEEKAKNAVALADERVKNAEEKAKNAAVVAEEKVKNAEEKVKNAAVVAEEKVKNAEEKIKNSDEILKLSNKITDLQLEKYQTDLLRLKNNFNLRGALEFSLLEYFRSLSVNLQLLASGKEVYKGCEKIIVENLMNEEEFREILKEQAQKRSLRVNDVDACVKALYHELSKHAHGNIAKLVVSQKEHTPTEVAAIVSVFQFLKKRNFLLVEWSEE